MARLTPRQTKLLKPGVGPKNTATVSSSRKLQKVSDRPNSDWKSGQLIAGPEDPLAGKRKFPPAKRDLSDVTFVEEEDRPENA